MPSPDNQFHLHYYRNQHKDIDLLSHQVQDGKLTISSAYQGIVTYDGLLEPILNLVNDQNVAYHQPVLEVPKIAQSKHFQATFKETFIWIK